MTSIGIYSKTCPVTSVLTGGRIKGSEGKAVLTLRDYGDKCVSRSGVEVRTVRRWLASQAVEQADSRLRHKDIVGIKCSG